MKLTARNTKVTQFALASLLGIGVTALPALASGSSAPTGEVSAAPGGSVTVKLSNNRLSYNGVAPNGQAALGYAADGTAQSMGLSLSKINVPDGTMMPVRVIMGRRAIINFSYYSTYGIVYTETDGTVTVSHGSASLSVSKANGDIVPDFPPVGTIGTTEVQVLSADGSAVILDGTNGSFRP